MGGWARLPSSSSGHTNIRCKIGMVETGRDRGAHWIFILFPGGIVSAFRLGEWGWSTVVNYTYLSRGTLGSSFKMVVLGEWSSLFPFSSLTRGCFCFCFAVHADQLVAAPPLSLSLSASFVGWNRSPSTFGLTSGLGRLACSLCADTVWYGSVWERKSLL